MTSAPARRSTINSPDPGRTNHHLTYVPTDSDGAPTGAQLAAETAQLRRWQVAASELTDKLLSSPGHRRPATITRHAAACAEADFASLTLRQGEDEINVAASSGAVDADAIARTTPIRDSTAGQVILTGQPALLRTERGRELPDRGDGAASVVIVPLSAGGDITGALTLSRTTNRPPFTETDLTFAAHFAAQAAVTLELANLRDTLPRLAQMADHDRITTDLHDHVIRGLFTVGLGLQGLASVTEHPVMLARITGYVDVLDQMIQDIRTTVFHLQRDDGEPTGAE